MDDSLEKIVRTSDPGWLRSLALLYRARQAGVLIDDAGLGINPEDQTLLQMARVSGLSRREIAGVSVALGMSGVGVTMVILAFLDPEPTSKLGLLVGGGAVCVLGGGFSAIRISDPAQAAQHPRHQTRHRNLLDVVRKLGQGVQAISNLRAR
jgi:hypothetical protein